MDLPTPQSRNRSSASSPRADCFELIGLVHCENYVYRRVVHTTNGKQYLICSARLDKVASFCDRNAVRQDELLQYVVTELEKKFLDPSSVEIQRAEIVEETHRSIQSGIRKKLRRQFGIIGEKLTKAKRRLLEVDAGMEVSVSKKSVSCRAQKEVRQQLTKADIPRSIWLPMRTKTPTRRSPLFFRLRHSLVKPDYKTLRNCLEKLIDRIVVKTSTTKQGQRYRY